jgi:hypothetical protein
MFKHATKDKYDGSGYYELRHDGRLLKRGDYTACVAALQSTCGYSIERAAIEGYTILPVAMNCLTGENKVG